MSPAFNMSSVYLVDGDAEFRRSLSLSLRARGLAVKTYDSAEAFLSDIGEAAAGCVVVDASLPGKSGIELINSLAAGNKCLTVVATGSPADGPLAAEAIDAGAASIVEKSFDASLLLTAISEAMRSMTTLARLRAEAKDLVTKLHALSVRERDVLEKIAQGLSIKEIANDLRLSPKSVETYRARLTEKLDANSSAALMRIALLASVVESS